MAEFNFESRLNKTKVGASFVAAYTTPDGCAHCMGDLEEGDTVGYVDDELVCETCYGNARNE